MEKRFGIVGCGRISHAHGIASQRLDGAVRFAACADISRDAAGAFAAAYGVNRTYTDYAEMLKEEDLNAVIFATWPAQHREQLETAIKSGVKYILCEKALAMTGEEALEIWQMANDAGVTIVEGFMYTHHPVISKLDELVRREESGEIDSVRATFHLRLPDVASDTPTWRQRKETGGSVPYDRTCYPVNACQRYADALPKRVSAHCDTSNNYDTITRLYGMVTYENDRIAIIESSNEAVFNEVLELTCANRVYSLNVPFTLPGDGLIREFEALKFSHVKEHEHVVKSPLPLQDDLPTYHAYTPQLANFLATVEGKKAPSPRLIDSVVNSYTLDALVRSGLDKRMIEIELPDSVRDAWEAD